MKNWLISIITMLVLLVIAEVVFRQLGRLPGHFQQNQWITIVDSLQPVYGFTADETGIFKVDTAIAFDIQRKARSTELDSFDISNYCLSNDYTIEVGALYSDHLKPELKQGGLWDVLESKKANLTAHDSITRWFWRNPVNADGFYSIPFQTEYSGKARLLLLGDSFLWGHTTSNKMLSFANTLLARGYCVFNTGISGADLPQYNAILKRYFSVVKPDVVVLNLFIGNDIMPFERTVTPHQPILYGTNAGNIYAFQAGKQFQTMSAAYNNVKRNMVVPKTNGLNRLASQTVITSLAWSVCARLGLIDHEFTSTPTDFDYLDSRSELGKLISFCDSVRVPLVISVIPELDGDELIGTDKFPTVFDKGVEYSEPELGLEDYSQFDGHFNDAGHRKYADHLEKLIEKKLSCEQ